MLLVLVALAGFVGVGPVLADGTPVAKPNDQTAAQGTTTQGTTTQAPTETPTDQGNGQGATAQAGKPSDEPAAEDTEVFVDNSGYDPEEAGNPLRIVAYVLHPVGVILDTLIFRPAYWLGSHEPIKTLVGQTD